MSHNLVHDYPVFSIPIPPDGIRAPPGLEARVRRACWAVFHVRLNVAVADVALEEAVGRFGSRAHTRADLVVSVQGLLYRNWIIDSTFSSIITTNEL